MAAKIGHERADNLLLWTELESEAAKEAWWRYSTDIEHKASAIGAILKHATLGPVVECNSGSTFNIRGTRKCGSRFSIDVLVPRDIPQGDAWVTWWAGLEDAGVQVRVDADYAAMVREASELDL